MRIHAGSRVKVVEKGYLDTNGNRTFGAVGTAKRRERGGRKVKFESGATAVIPEGDLRNVTKIETPWN